ncbi:hypothetical protein OG226_41615 [Streptomyces sp. NBC_01261]|uniref:hypothetical protein n=1 Tax=unclassified Streptomyces TaxID=2593676 RepID=UPI002E30E2BF|nr:hypothetical protein [Streptomyces sp. NBC_01261]
MELPEEFADLERFLGRWRLRDSQERMAAMAAADIDELRELCAAVLPRIEAVVSHLNAFPLDNMPPREQALYELALTFAEVTHPVDLGWATPEVSDLFPNDRMNLVGPALAW